MYFEELIGDREAVDEEEKRLILLNNRNPRAIRRILADWQRLYRLVDFES